MTATIILDGLCIIVPDTEDVQQARNLYAVLVDGEKTDPPIPRHAPVLDFKKGDFVGGNTDLLQPHPDKPGYLRVDLRGWIVHVSSKGGPQAFTAVGLEYLPDLRKACGQGRIHPDCIHRPERRPVATLLSLPFGQIECNHDLTGEEWMFDPSVNGIYCQKFCQEVRLVIEGTEEVVFEFKSLDGAEGADKVELRPTDAVRITNEPEDATIRVREELRRRVGSRGLRGTVRQVEDRPEIEHSLAYYDLLEVAPAKHPVAKPNPGCAGKPGTLSGDGIGCAPVLMVGPSAQEVPVTGGAK